jgi:hypothetical protein
MQLRSSRRKLKAKYLKSKKLKRNLNLLRQIRVQNLIKRSNSQTSKLRPRKTKALLLIPHLSAFLLVNSQL